LRSIAQIIVANLSKTNKISLVLNFGYKLNHQKSIKIYKVDTMTNILKQ